MLQKSFRQCYRETYRATWQNQIEIHVNIGLLYIKKSSQYYLVLNNEFCNYKIIDSKKQIYIFEWNYRRVFYVSLVYCTLSNIRTNATAYNMCF